MWKRVLALACFALLALAKPAHAILSTCGVTGTVYKADTTACANCNIQFRPVTTQPFGNDTVAIPSITVTTDSSGNIPAGVVFPQGERMTVQVGQDKPIGVTIPSAGCPVTFGVLYTSGITPPFPVGGGPPGSPPQIVGYSSPNVLEAETVSGDSSLTRTGTSAYHSTVTGENGFPFSAATPSTGQLMTFEFDGITMSWQPGTVVPAGASAFSAPAFCADLSGHDCTLIGPPFFYDDTGGSGNFFGLLYSQGPLTNAAFTNQGAIGSIVIGNGAAAPGFALSPIAWNGTGNAVVPSVTAPSVFAVNGSSTPVPTSSEGTVSIITYNEGTVGGGSTSLGAFTCDGYNAAGVASSPAPGSYLYGIRDNRATTTTTCITTGAAPCFSTTLHTISSGHQYNFIVVPSDNSNCTANGTPFPCCTGVGTGTCTDPTALVPKCDVKLY